MVESYQTSVRSIVRHWIVRFPPRGAVGVRLFKSSNQFTAYNFYPIELKFGRMILDISPLDRSVPDYSISIQGRCGGRHLRSSIRLQPTVFMRLSWNSIRWYWTTDRYRFTAYSSYAIEMKLGRMILSRIFRFPPGGAVGARLSKFSNQFTIYCIYPLDFELDMIIPSSPSAQSV